MDLLIVLIVILLLFGSGGIWYTGRPGYDGPPVGILLTALLTALVIVVVLRILGVM